MQKSLIELKSKESGIIKQIQGGKRLNEKLSSLGVYINKNITKISGALLQGPVVIRIDKMEIALGRGMASKILVEIKE